MCGIAGFWGPPDRALLASMTGALIHRGPDDEGFFESPEVSLGHRRLSIIDISGGHQPIGNEDGTVLLAYNGEIYNFRELRAELTTLGHTFATRSDSEVIVHAYEEWGPDCFIRFNGMWAVAIADLQAQRVILGRDHFGIKPLYYARSGERWLFASEIKALLRDPALTVAPDERMLYAYLAHGLHDHRDETFFEGILRVPAATYAIVDGGGVRLNRYWEPALGTDGPVDPPGFAEAFRLAVDRRLVADVPVGTCLSGGLDSSSIVSLMTGLLRQEAPDAASLRGRVKTYSAVFDGDPIDEQEYIREELAATGADSTLCRPTSDAFVRELTDLIWHQEEPFVSTGPYAQWCVMRQAATDVKVVLDGQGGDELLGGYVPYQFVYLRQLLRERRWGSLLREAWAGRDVLWPLLRGRLRPGRRSLSGTALLDPQFVARAAAPAPRRTQDNLKARLLEDLLLYSLPPLLRYEDRNSMAHSIESRLPYLDQEFVTQILRLPDRALVRGGWSRAILRDAMAGVLPEKIRLRRWKVGFTTPESRWLFARRAVFQSLLHSPAFLARPYWNGQAVAQAFRRAAAGRLDVGLLLWRVINVELWLRVFFPASVDTSGRPGFAALGDAAVASQRPEARALLTRFAPNAGRHLFIMAGDATYARVPLRTPLVSAGDDLVAVITEAIGTEIRPGDTLAVSEKIVAISQGRSYPVAEVHPSWLARLLVRFVQKSPYGIGLGIPQTMELALREAGAARVLLAAAVTAVTRPLGFRGVFYKVMGPLISAIDGPTSGTIPPYNTHAKLGPKDPDGVARGLAQAFGSGVEVAIIDANDLGVKVLGRSEGLDADLVRHLLVDNPLGQGKQQTPVALIRAV